MTWRIVPTPRRMTLGRHDRATSARHDPMTPGRHDRMTSARHDRATSARHDPMTPGRHDRMTSARHDRATPAHRRRIGVVAAMAAAGLALTACGAVEPATVTGTAGALTVALTVPEPSAGAQDAEVLVTDAGGNPVADASVVAGATMPRMGHAGQVTTARPLGGGRYALEGDLFPMSGRWDVRVRVEREGPATEPPAGPRTEQPDELTTEQPDELTTEQPDELTTEQPDDTTETVLPIVIR
ncbi:MAG: FixH family protein [Dermatophilaceae bacterium]